MGKVCDTIYSKTFVTNDEGRASQGTLNVSIDACSNDGGRKVYYETRIEDCSSLRKCFASIFLPFAGTVNSGTFKSFRDAYRYISGKFRGRGIDVPETTPDIYVYYNETFDSLSIPGGLIRHIRSFPTQEVCHYASPDIPIGISIGRGVYSMLIKPCVLPQDARNCPDSHGYLLGTVGSTEPFKPVAFLPAKKVCNSVPKIPDEALRTYDSPVGYIRSEDL